MADFRIQAVAEYLRAEYWLTQVLRLCGAKKLMPDENANRRFLPLPLPYFLLNIERSVATEAALTALSSLEIALRTSIYYFDSKEPPLSRDLVQSFAGLSLSSLYNNPHGAAADFMFRYVERDWYKQGELKQRFPDHSDLSFGEISGLVELADHLINNKHIHGFLLQMESQREDEKELPPSKLFSPVFLAYQLYRGSDPGQGMADFFEFTSNIDGLAHSNSDLFDKKTGGKSSLYMGLMDCFGFVYINNFRFLQKSLAKWRDSRREEKSSYWDRIEDTLQSYANAPARWADKDTIQSISEWALKRDDTSSTSKFLRG
jgi:hypothetical protein